LAAERSCVLAFGIMDKAFGLLLFVIFFGFLLYFLPIVCRP
jgi:hypothetical protein